MPQFLGSDQDWDEGVQTLGALSSQGDSGYQGLEGLHVNSTHVEFSCDEVTAVCPVTGQPDLYNVQIRINAAKSIESKSLKLYFVTLRNEGIFCENLAARIKADVLEALRKVQGGEYIDASHVGIRVTQKSRGGISIEAYA